MTEQRKGMKKLFWDWFSDPTNQYFEMGRALWALGAVAMLGFTGWHLYQNGEFEVTDFGFAYAALLAAGGFGIATKDKGAASVGEPR